MTTYIILLTTVRDFNITIIFPKVEKLLSPGLQLANNYHHITWKWYYTKKNYNYFENLTFMNILKCCLNIQILLETEHTSSIIRCRLSYTCMMRMTCIKCAGYQAETFEENFKQKKFVRFFQLSAYQNFCNNRFTTVPLIPTKL